MSASSTFHGFTLLACGVALLAPAASVRAQHAGAVPPAPATAPADTGLRMKLRSFTVIVRDYDEAKSWYVSKLGFATLVDRKFGAGQRFVLVAPPGQREPAIVLEQAQRNDPTMPADYSDRIGKEVNIVVATNDLTRLATVLKERGVRFRQEPRKQAWDGEAIIEDLYGNSIVLVGPIKP